MTKNLYTPFPAEKKTNKTTYFFMISGQGRLPINKDLFSHTYSLHNISKHFCCM